MKSIKSAILIAVLACGFISCSKGGEEDDMDCESNRQINVTFTNTGSQPLRVQVAIQLTPQYEAIDPVVTIDLAPGASAVRQIPADRYMLVWKANCATTCTMASTYAKTYETCTDYEEKRGV